MRIPELIAHRGYAAHFPENTLPALEAAVAAGARLVEIDVQLSADGVPVLFHDQGLRRVCGVSGSLHRRRYSELQALSAHEPARLGKRFVGTPLVSLARFRRFLEENPGVTAFVEAKPAAVRHFGVDRMLDAIAGALQPVAPRSVLISSSVPLLRAARDRTAGGLEPLGWHALGGVIERWRQRWALSELRPEYLFCAVRGLPRNGEIRFPPARIAVYEITSASLAVALRRRGVDLIETFAIAELGRDLQRFAHSVVDSGGDGQ